MKLGPATAASKLPFLNPAMERYGINTYLREAAFLATIAYESDYLTVFTEIWGPTAAQNSYEMNSSLGNVMKGDGYKFRGRGAIQITGRANYEEASSALGYDFAVDPNALATPMWAIDSAAWWWQRHGCNEEADKPDFKRCTRIVNGGYTGLADRTDIYNRAIAVLRPDFSNVLAGSDSTA